MMPSPDDLFTAPVKTVVGCDFGFPLPRLRPERTPVQRFSLLAPGKHVLCFAQDTASRVSIVHMVHAQSTRSSDMDMDMDMEVHMQVRMRMFESEIMCCL